MKKAFTLIELTIVIIILAILIGIIFEVFIMIAHIAIRVKNERILHDEVMYVTQTIQNIIDRGDTVFYGDPNAINGYDDGFTLSGSFGLFVFTYSTGSKTIELSVEGGGEGMPSFRLTDPSRIIINNFYIKRIPYRGQGVYENTMHDGFWLFLDTQVPSYDADKWWHRIDWELQTFFNLRTYD